MKLDVKHSLLLFFVWVCVAFLWVASSVVLNAGDILQGAILLGVTQGLTILLIKDLLENYLKIGHKA